ncbi:MAG TPA: glycosyltransferase family 2 protein [Flavisolibacter sp.]|jgi:glycosyltransferase involved in cell wall biosynthesis|nr:glycosyltransferase family 2 protein [Flavisolibacter sp.]
MSLPANGPGVFVIIAAYNEAATIGTVVEALMGKDYTIVVVDDGSDQSIQPLLQDKPVYLLSHKINLGQGAALQTGIEFALEKGAEVIVTFDADGQHRTPDIPVLVEALTRTSADIAFGSRFLQTTHGVPLRRKFLLQAARFVNLLFTGLMLSDAHNGLRAITAAAAKKIKIEENRMAHATEILWQVEKLNLRYVEVPVQINYTTYSTQKGQGLADAFRILFDLFLNKIFK